MEKISVATIGFTKSTAEFFFERVRRSSVKRVVDVRLHNTSQLAGFAKSNDLAYFLKNVCNVDYVHQPILAPTDDILKSYKRDNGDWETYQKLFLKLMADRKIEIKLKPEMFEGVCLLCSEATPHNCHRRLVCEYLNEKWDGKLQVKHL